VGGLKRGDDEPDRGGGLPGGKKKKRIASWRDAGERPVEDPCEDGKKKWQKKNGHQRGHKNRGRIRNRKEKRLCGKKHGGRGIESRQRLKLGRRS